jgi:hypothetical protein
MVIFHSYVSLPEGMLVYSWYFEKNSKAGNMFFMPRGGPFPIYKPLLLWGSNGYAFKVGASVGHRYQFEACPRAPGWNNCSWFIPLGICREWTASNSVRNCWSLVLSLLKQKPTLSCLLSRTDRILLKTTTDRNFWCLQNDPPNFGNRILFGVRRSTGSKITPSCSEFVHHHLHCLQTKRHEALQKGTCDW